MTQPQLSTKTSASLCAAYLDLLENSLAFSLWPDPPELIQLSAYQSQSRLKWLAVSVLAKIAGLCGWQLARLPATTDAERREGRVWRQYPDTMVGKLRLANIRQCVESVLAEGIPGDLIETGAWRGGACIYMRGILAAHGVNDRKVYVADSFEGLPVPDEDKYPADKGDKHHLSEFLAVDIDAVKRNFARFNLLDDQVIFLKGWFKDTLPTAPIEKISVLRLDGDMYGSTMDALTALYDRLSPGGFCIVDDYALEGCRKAVDEFRAERQVTARLETIDWTGRFWRKPC